MENSIPERLTRVETSLAALATTVNATAADVRAVRDHMLTSKARSAGGWRVLTLLGALIAGVASLGGAVGAVAAVFVKH